MEESTDSPSSATGRSPPIFVVLTVVMGVGEVFTFLRNWRPLLLL
jgi:hypothetical protein